MADTNLTIEQIETLIVGFVDSPFYIRKYNVVPNVSWGLLNHEADLLALSRSGYLTEIEIKRSWEDFKADFKKSHTHDSPFINRLYYAVPESIGEKVFNFLYEGKYQGGKWLHYTRSKVTGYTENNPHMCGLILYADCDLSHPMGNVGINVLAKKMNGKELSIYDQLSLLRLGNMRVWNLKKKFAKYQAEHSLFK